jgi:hypothetical protein
MRRILILFVTLVVAAAALAALWIFKGSEIASFIDRYWTVESGSAPISSIGYEGSGSGGIFIINDVSLSLNEVRPNLSLSVGSTKDNQLALATSGRVFPFGPLTSTENLATRPPPGDQAFLATRHSFLSWPTPFDMNLLTGQSPSWKRNIYQEIRWKKSSGTRLQMVWRYEQFFYHGTGWTSGLMTREGSTGVIRVDIKE